MELRHRLMLLEARTDAQIRREKTQSAIYALVSLRTYFPPEEDSMSLVKAWVAEDENLRREIHNYDEFLKL